MFHEDADGRCDNEKWNNCNTGALTYCTGSSDPWPSTHIPPEDNCYFYYDFCGLFRLEDDSIKLGISTKKCPIDNKNTIHGPFPFQMYFETRRSECLTPRQNGTCWVDDDGSQSTPAISNLIDVY